MRLAFSVVTSMDPDVLLIDEVLAVGDHSFQARCLEKIHELRDRGKTLVVVSHATELVQQFCDRSLWLDHGEVQGPVWKIMETYLGQRTTAH